MLGQLEGQNKADGYFTGGLRFCSGVGRSLGGETGRVRCWTSRGEVEFEVLAADDREAGCGAETPETESLKHIEISHVEMKVNYLRMNVFPPLQWQLLGEQTWFALQQPQYKE